MSKARDIADLGGVTTRLDQVGNSDGALSNRNLVINGAMQVAQRGTSKTVTAANTYLLDRFQAYSGNPSTYGYTVSQETDSPNGFSNSLKYNFDDADASPSTEHSIYHKMEGQNLQQLQKGTSSAKSVTLSFWCKASLAGTYIVELMDNDNSNRHISKSYSISAVNTWEYKAVTFEGDTVGALANDAGNSLAITYWLAASSSNTIGTLQTSWGPLSQGNRAVGQTNLGATANNSFFITGVQLELGDTATPFEHISYADQLQKCQRFYYCFEKADSGEHNGFLAVSYNANSAYFPIHFPVEMRTSPTFRIGGLWATRLNNNNQFAASPGLQNNSKAGGVYYTAVSSVPASTAFWVEPSSADTSNTAYMNFDAEL